MEYSTCNRPNYLVDHVARGAASLGRVSRICNGFSLCANFLIFRLTSVTRDHVLLSYLASLSSPASLSRSSDWMTRVCGAARLVVIVAVIAADGAVPVTPLCGAAVPETPHVSSQPLCRVPICAGISRWKLGRVILSLSLRALPIKAPRRRTLCCSLSLSLYAHSQSTSFKYPPLTLKRSANIFSFNVAIRNLFLV